MDIIQGVTPKITLTCNNFNPKEMELIEVNCKNGDYVITRVGEDLELTPTTIVFYLTQNETLNLKTNKDVYIQIRVMTGHMLPNNQKEIKASNIVKKSVGEFIGEGVL